MIKQRYWPPAIAFWVLIVGAFLWLGWEGAVLAFVAFVVGAAGTAYNTSKVIKHVYGDR